MHDAGAALMQTSLNANAYTQHRRFSQRRQLQTAAALAITTSRYNTRLANMQTCCSLHVTSGTLPPLEHLPSQHLTTSPSATQPPCSHPHEKRMGLLLRAPAHGTPPVPSYNVTSSVIDWYIYSTPHAPRALICNGCGAANGATLTPPFTSFGTCAPRMRLACATTYGPPVLMRPSQLLQNPHLASFVR